MKPGHARALFVLFVTAVLLREAAAAYVNVHPTRGLMSPDPDDYLRAGLLLTSGGWHWTFDAVSMYAGFVKAPLYPVFLSAFARMPDYPRVVPYVQALLSASTVVGVFVLADAMHSRRAAFIAAAAGTVWFSSVISPPGIWQEQLYTPLLVAAMATTAVALERQRLSAFLAAGLLLGCAALVRSMPVYFFIVTAIAWRWVHEPARARGSHLLAWSIGFLVMTAPYVAALSAHAGRFIPIENFGFARLDRYDPPGQAISTAFGPAYHVTTAAAIAVRQLAADPLWVIRRAAYPFAALAMPSGSAWLHTYYVAPDAGTGRLASWIVHLWGDVPEALVLLLAPFGVLLARRRRVAGALALWCAVHVLAVAATGDAGPRYRFPIEFLLLAFASVVVAGGWRRPTMRVAVAASTASLAIAAVLAHFVPFVVHVRPDYGLGKWEPHVDGRLNAVRGPAGFNVAGYRELVRFRVRCRPMGPCGAIGVVVDGRPAAGISEADARASAWYTVNRVDTGPLAYVELSPSAGAVLDLDVDDSGGSASLLMANGVSWGDTYPE